jgi:hypothetical protein
LREAGYLQLLTPIHTRMGYGLIRNGDGGGNIKIFYEKALLFVFRKASMYS